MNEMSPIGAADARALTDQIKVAVEATWELVKRAYVERAWSALGYDGWDDYCTREFGTSRLRLPREERTEVVASLRESGLSTRAIAAATGLSQKTVSREVAAGESFDSPVVGTDGKTYSQRQHTSISDESSDEVGGMVDDRDPADMSDQDWIDAAYDADALIEDEPAEEDRPITEPSPAPAVPTQQRRRPLPESFDTAVFNLKRAVDTVARLTADDRLEKNKDQVKASNLSDLVRVRDALNGVINTIEG